MSAKLTPDIAWLLLVVAGLLEIAWSVSMKASLHQGQFHNDHARGGRTQLLAPGLAMRELPVGSAYAIWTGIGAVGATLVGILLFDESVTLSRIGCIALIVCGILGLKLAGGRSAA